MKSAHPFFRRAFELDQARLGGEGMRHTTFGGLKIEGDPLVISYYALGMGLEEQETATAMKLAKWAVQQDKGSWEILCNFAHLSLRTGQRGLASRSLEAADRLSPANARIRSLWDEIGRRGSPPLPFLKRTNLINKYLGMLLRKK